LERNGLSKLPKKEYCFSKKNLLEKAERDNLCYCFKHNDGDRVSCKITLGLAKPTNEF